MVTIDQVIAEHYPTLNQRRLSGPIIKSVLRHLVHEQAFQEFAAEYPYLHGIEFIEQVLEYFHCSYAVNDRQRENIPITGKVVIIANHPLGSLDGLVLLKLVHEVRSDVKIVANGLLMTIPPLYKQYTELCEPGDVVFLDFNVDPAFNNCIDGLVIVDTHKLKMQKRKRYMEETILVS